MIVDGSCITARIRIISVQSPAAGTPTTSIPSPAKIDWITATPRTPRVTLRMLDAASSAIAGPFSPAIMNATLRANSAARSRFGNNAPAMKIATMNSSKPKPRSPTVDTSQTPTSLRYGAALSSTDSKFWDALSQMSFNRSPTIGQSAMPSGGGGTVICSCLKSSDQSAVDSTKLAPRAIVGTMRTKRATTTKKAAASFGRPPRAWLSLA